MASTMSLCDSDGLYVLINIVPVKNIVHRGKCIINPWILIPFSRAVLCFKPSLPRTGRHMLKCFTVSELKTVKHNIAALTIISPSLSIALAIDSPGYQGR